MRDLTELRRKAEAASPGCWCAIPSGNRPEVVHSTRAGWGNGRICVVESLVPVADAAYLVAAQPTAILALLDRLERAEADSKGWARLVGEMLAAVPLGHVLKAGTTGADFVSYVKGCAAENDRLRGLLAATPTAPGDEINGCVLVPKEPTEAMCEAAYEWRENGEAGERWVAAVKSPGDAYRAMLAAVKAAAIRSGA